MLPFVGEIKEVICMPSGKISKNITTGFVFVKEKKFSGIQGKKEN